MISIISCNCDDITKEMNDALVDTYKEMSDLYLSMNNICMGNKASSPIKLIEYYMDTNNIKKTDNDKIYISGCPYNADKNRGLYESLYNGGYKYGQVILIPIRAYRTMFYDKGSILKDKLISFIKDFIKNTKETRYEYIKTKIAKRGLLIGARLGNYILAYYLIRYGFEISIYDISDNFDNTSSEIELSLKESLINYMEHGAFHIVRGNISINDTTSGFEIEGDSGKEFSFIVVTADTLKDNSILKSTSLNERSDNVFIMPQSFAGILKLVKNIKDEFVMGERVIANTSPYVDADKCNGCGLCMYACNFNAIEVVNKLSRSNPTRCRQCDNCISICPSGARASKNIFNITNNNYKDTSGATIICSRLIDNSNLHTDTNYIYHVNCLSAIDIKKLSLMIKNGIKDITIIDCNLKECIFYKKKDVWKDKIEFIKKNYNININIKIYEDATNE